MSFLPAVRARLTERYILNFRMPPVKLEKYLPAPWLRPHVIRGHAIVSFCLLDLRDITISPLAARSGLRSVSCAPRFAVIDESQKGAPPAVYVTERRTSSAFGAWFTSLGFSAPHPYAAAQIRRQDQAIEIVVTERGEGQHFEAILRPDRAARSEVFADPQEFGEFIKVGVTSYGLSRYPGLLTRLDLRKTEGRYDPLETMAIHSPVVNQWAADGAVLDSAFRTVGGSYEWSYKGLVAA
jgi:hypothetical protein